MIISKIFYNLYYKTYIILLYGNSIYIYKQTEIKNSLKNFGYITWV